MYSYERAKRLVKVYEKYTQDRFKPTGNEELDLLRKYLLHDIRLINAIMHDYTQIEIANFGLDSSAVDLIEFHEKWQTSYYQDVFEQLNFLNGKYERNKNIFLKTVNFYLTGAYTRYGIDEDTALEIVAKITGISKETLLKAKENKIPAVKMEDELDQVSSIETLWAFNTSSISTDMPKLLAEYDYETLDLENKIIAVKKSLKTYLIKVICQCVYHRDFFRDFAKDEEDWLELILASSSSGDLNAQDIINYLLSIIESLGKPLTIVSCLDSSVKAPFVEDDKIMVPQNTDPVELFSFIYKKLLSIEFIEKGRILNK